MAYKRKRYRYKLRYKVLFWSLIFMIFFSVASIFMNRPSRGTVIKPTLEDDPAEVSQEQNTNTMTTKYFRLKYTSGLDTVSNIGSDDKTALEVYRVARNDKTGRRTFVITIKKTPQGGMNEESSYKLRQINPATYQQSSETLGSLAYVMFKKNDGHEVTAFTSHGDIFAMLAYTVDAQNADIYDEASALFANFAWIN